MFWEYCWTFGLKLHTLVFWKMMHVHMYTMNTAVHKLPSYQFSCKIHGPRFSEISQLSFWTNAELLGALSALSSSILCVCVFLFSKAELFLLIQTANSCTAVLVNSHFRSLNYCTSLVPRLSPHVNFHTASDGSWAWEQGSYCTRAQLTHSLLVLYILY